MKIIWVIEIKQEGGWMPFDCDTDWSRQKARDSLDWLNSNGIGNKYRVAAYVRRADNG